jgi:hypothetical protein
MIVDVSIILVTGANKAWAERQLAARWPKVMTFGLLRAMPSVGEQRRKSLAHGPWF